MSFADPRWLWLLLAAIPLGALALRFFVQMSSVRRWSAIVARTVLIGLLAGVLAGAATVRTAEELAVVAVVDVSGSVRSFAPARSLDPEAIAGEPIAVAAQRLLERATLGRGEDDLAGVVAFAGRSIAVATPTRTDASARSIDIQITEGTDIERALRTAAALVPPSATGRVLLVSDGVATSGDALAAARDLASGPSPVRVDVVPIEYAATAEVAVESVDAPPRAAPGSPVTVRVGLRAAERSSGALLLTREGEPIDLNGSAPGFGLPVQLEPGLNVRRLTVPLADARVHRFEAVFEPDRIAGRDTDTHPGNNRGGAFTLTPGAGSALVIDGSGQARETGTGAFIARTLEQAGVTTQLVTPEGAPTELLGFQNHDLIVLNSVPADAFDAATHELLVAFVRDLGGGLVMVGGDGSFGAGGWRGSALEEILPVKLDLPERMVIPEAAVVFVLDRSGSMQRSLAGSSRTLQQIANEAAVTAMRSLDPGDLVGVVAFNDQPTKSVPLQSLENLPEFEPRVLGIAPNGGTSIGPALREAQSMLAGVEARLKHVIVLSDGAASDKEELPDIATSLRDDGIRISTIAVGNEADGGTLEAVAVRGQGVFFTVINPLSLPRIFLRAVRIVRTPMIREGRFEPVMTATGSPVFTAVEDQLAQTPPLYGLVLTQARTEPGIVTTLSTPKGEPVLADWQVGLGRVVAITTGAGQWMRDWSPWPGYSSLWEAIARTASRSSADSGAVLRAEHEGGRLNLTLDALDDRGRPIDLLDVPVTVYAPSGEPRTVRLQQTGPGVYSGSIEADDRGGYVALARPTKNGRALRPTIGGASVSEGGEYRSLESNAALLREIARVTGGRVLDPASLNAETLFDRSDVVPRRTTLPLWPSLLAWAIFVLMLDIGTRRIAWDRYGAIEAPAEAGVLAGERLAQAKGRTKRSSEVALGDADARRVRAEQIRARKPQRPPKTGPAPIEKIEKKEESDSSEGLLAAKRRARKRYESD